MNMKIIWALVLAVAVGLLAWGVSFIHIGTAPSGTGAATSTPPGQLSDKGDYVYTEGDQYSTVEIHYPAKTSLGTEANLAAMDTIERGLQAELTTFKQDEQQMLSDEEKARLVQGGVKYAFDAEFKEYTSAHFDSFLYAIYVDTGGAHPNGYFKTFVFSQSGAAINISQLFAPGSDYLAPLSKAAETQVKAQLSDRLGTDAASSAFAEGYAPTADNFQNFGLDGDTLHLYFPPYQVAAFAAGAFDIAIPLSQLSGILAPGVR